MSGFTLAGVAVLFVTDSRGDDSAVALPPSEFSLGICTFSRGRLAFSCVLFARGGGGMSEIEGMDGGRWGSVTALAGGEGAADGPDTLWPLLFSCENSDLGG